MTRLVDDLASDIVRSQLYILRTSEGMKKDVTKALDKLERQVIAMVLDVDLSRYTRARTQNLLAGIRDVLREFAQEQNVKMRRELTNIAALVFARLSRDLKDLFRVDVFSGELEARKVLSILNDRAILGGATLAEFWDTQPFRMTAAYSQAIRTGVLTNQTTADIIKNIVASPLVSGTKNEITTLVRTSVMNVANAARDTLYQENADIIKGIQWLSTLDGRTSNICKALDGLAWKLPSYEPIGHDKSYPGSIAHPNCRSTQVPLLRSFAEMATKNKDLAEKLGQSLSKGTRASMDGQVAQNLDYEDWLKKKGDGFAREVLGPSRFDLWKQGKLNLRELTDESNNPLTLAELDKVL